MIENNQDYKLIKGYIGQLHEDMIDKKDKRALETGINMLVWDWLEIKKNLSPNELNSADFSETAEKLRDIAVAKNDYFNNSSRKSKFWKLFSIVLNFLHEGKLKSCAQIAIEAIGDLPLPQQSTELSRLNRQVTDQPSPQSRLSPEVANPPSPGPIAATPVSRFADRKIVCPDIEVPVSIPPSFFEDSNPVEEIPAEPAREKTKIELRKEARQEFQETLKLQREEQERQEKELEKAFRAQREARLAEQINPLDMPELNPDQWIFIDTEGKRLVWTDTTQPGRRFIQTNLEYNKIGSQRSKEEFFKFLATPPEPQEAPAPTAAPLPPMHPQKPSIKTQVTDFAKELWGKIGRKNSP